MYELNGGRIIILKKKTKMKTKNQQEKQSQNQSVSYALKKHQICYIPIAYTYAFVMFVT